MSQVSYQVDYRGLFDLTGKVALVIGAGSGIGQATAQGLHAFGARVICADRDASSAETTATLLGANASFVELDITNKAQVDTVFAAIAQEGPLDILICTPSINVRKPLLDYSEDEFDRVVKVNFKGSFFAMQAAGNIMKAQERGSIILYSSIRSQVVEPGQSIYAGTKAATLQMVKTLAAELGPHKVRVNAIAPGVVETPLTAQIKSKPDWYQAYASKNALGRWAQPSEMVGAAIFLASEAASYVTGTLLAVDAGWLAVDGRFTPPL